jgi:hypothetical protein
MKKTIIVIIVVSIFSFFYFAKFRTNIYVGNTHCPRKDGGIDIQLKINNEIVLDDSLYYNPWEYKNIGVKLNCGIHKVEVTSIKANIHQKEKIFLFFGQFILVDFFSADSLCYSLSDLPLMEIDSVVEKKYISDDFFIESEPIIFNTKSFFDIMTRFKPVYYE